MVFGELLGGVAMRAGERFNENTQRQRAIEDWQRSQRLGMWTDMIRKDWDNMQADQQEAVINQMAPDLGIKPKDAASMITAARGIHGLIPQIQAVPESLGPKGRQGTVNDIQISDLPQPADVLSPTIMAPTTGGVASFGRDMTPNQIKAQQIADQVQAVRQQNIGSIEQQAGLDPLLKQAMISNQYGFNPSGLISSGIAADSRERIAADKASQFQNGDRLIVRNGVPIPIRNTGRDTFEMDTATGKWVPHVPQATDEVWEKSMPKRTVTGANDTYAFDPKKGTAEALHIGAKAARTGSAAGASSKPVRVQTVDPNTGQRVWTWVQPQVGTTIAAAPNMSESKVLRESEGAYQQVLDVGELVKPDYLGAVRGSQADLAIRSKFPWAAGLVGRPEISTQESMFRAMAASMRNNLIKLMSGQAVSASEQVRILSELPDPSNPGTWEGNYAKTKRNAEILINGIRKQTGVGQQVPVTPLSGMDATSVNTQGAESPEARKERLRQKYGVR